MILELTVKYMCRSSLPRGALFEAKSSRLEAVLSGTEAALSPKRLTRPSALLRHLMKWPLKVLTKTLCE